VLEWEDGGEVIVSLDETPGGTLVRVVESSPDVGLALELRAFAWTAVA
jgi:hypothetical protein